MGDLEGDEKIFSLAKKKMLAPIKAAATASSSSRSTAPAAKGMRPANAKAHEAADAAPVVQVKRH